MDTKVAGCQQRQQEQGGSSAQGVQDLFATGTGGWRIPIAPVHSSFVADFVNEEIAVKQQVTERVLDAAKQSKHAAQ